MKKFRDYKISRKLSTGFLGVVIIMIIVATTGILGMYRINEMDTILYSTETAPVVHLINATKSLYQIRVDTRGAVINAGNTQKIETYETSYLSQKDNFLKESSLYRASLSNKDSLALFDEAADIFTNDFDPVIQKTFELAKAGNQAAADAAGASATDKIQTLFQNYDTLVDHGVMSAKNTSETNDVTAVTLIIVLLVLTIIGAAVAIYLGMKISHIISAPIVKLVSAANELALGHVDIDLSNTDSADEIGQLALAFQQMLSSIRDQVSIAESFSNGDFSQKVLPRSDKDILGIALQKIKLELNGTMSLIKDAAEQVNSGASQVAAASQALASGATEQAAAVEELSASIATVEKQAEENSENVKKAAGFVAETDASVSEGNEQMKQLTNAMQEIQNASDKISSITKIIEDIAFQTNILALNAAIEAARAGDAGKGFAVVADEVRNLAAKSSDAAKQTSQLIQHSSSVIAEGGQYAGRTAQVLIDIAERATMVNDSIHQIELASSDQVGAIEQITQGLSQVSSVVQTNAATAEESSASSEELAAQAQMLLSEVIKFTLEATD